MVKMNNYEYPQSTKCNELIETTLSAFHVSALYYSSVVTKRGSHSKERLLSLPLPLPPTLRRTYNTEEARVG
ncbi:hypothetical protein TCAL_15780 [Tigriopus californicus]|uniref:Uncharacterized protein n=1 Tax=Tigriopus californicus TaxID=6832 RepID=A0A553P6I4_TIGCA|nr:hypothetical protein TCAL_15780 [Tigriopus californicus]